MLVEPNRSVNEVSGYHRHRHRHARTLQDLDAGLSRGQLSRPLVYEVAGHRHDPAREHRGLELGQIEEARGIQINRDGSFGRSFLHGARGAGAGVPLGAGIDAGGSWKKQL